MAWLYVTLILAAVACYVSRLYSLPPVDDDVAVEAIFGKGDSGDTSRRPPVFARGGAGRHAPENTLAAIQVAAERIAEGIVVDLSFTRDDAGVLFHGEILERTTNGEGLLADTSFEDLRRLDAGSKHPLSKNCLCVRVPTLEEGVNQCLRLGLRFIVRVKRYDYRAVALLDALFRQRPKLYRRGLVSSSDPWFIYALRYRNPDIVTALIWRPRLLAYEDAEERRPRFDTRKEHLIAKVGDWFLEQALNTGLLHYVTGASALLADPNTLNAESVRTWRDRGVHVIAWTPNDRVEKKYFLQVLHVPIITDTLSLKVRPGGTRRTHLAVCPHQCSGERSEERSSALWRKIIRKPNHCGK
ncbi:glycerophosphodiester phosphodiesterase 1 [Dermacentor silvarum]|uniref:glycerophosphodiester phosphodiesterase 1 n=1 Tax=Dermacentor silvarum TaxID=543639 RepID=UPI0018984871|nr:glycerophosphodiester phosphodiesterase 1 [Dermacentor silvarum]